MKLVDNVIKHTLSGFSAGHAGNTAANGFVSNPENLGFNALGIQYAAYFR